ncbi:MAG: SusC/RagA family TonB-linked outer membrane protein [Bacteroides sp.]|nr:SusC/RagA family TonB-linked outer membrane protein [Bacteroides sp.]
MQYHLKTKVFTSRCVLWLLFMTLFSGSLYAQNIKATGVVLDSEDEPLTGATVSVVGTKKAVATDIDGKFTIDIKAGQVLQFRYIGCKPFNYQVKNDKPLTIHLESDDNTLDEVVVTAMGISREARALSYARQSVDTESMTEARGTSLMDMLAGKAAGMQVVAGGGPTASTRVVLRGNNSLTGNNQPLYVIDGVPVLNNSGEDGDLDYGNPVNSINPDEIENIEVLKGANASALYGSDAANGVILITTKSAQAKKGFGVSYDFNMMFGHLYSYPTYQNIYGAGQNTGFQRWQGVNFYGNENNGVKFDPNLPYFAWSPNMAAQDQRSWGLPMLGFTTIGRNGQATAYSPHPETIKDMYKHSTMITNSVQVEKVFEGGSFRLAYSNVHSDDILADINKLNRNNFNFRGTADLAKWVSVDANARYTYETVDNRGFRNASKRNPLYVIANLPRDVSTDELIPWKQPDGSAMNFKGFVNPYWVLNETSNADSKNWFVGNVTLNFKLPYNLTLRGRAATDAQFYDGWTFANIGFPDDMAYNDGEYVRWKRQWTNNNFDVLLSYNKRFFNNKFNISANVGTSYQEIEGSKISSKVDILQFPDVKSLANNKGLMSSTEEYEHKKKEAVYGMGSFGYDNWAYLDLTARNEWSSTLPKDNNSYFYWSAGLGVVASDLFKLDPHLFPFLKIRGSYAQVGNDTGFDRLISGYYKDATNYTFNGIPYYMGDRVLKSMGLKPERTRSWELGAELRFLDNRISIDATYYNKVTRDQIVEADAPLASGYEREIINAGKMQNRGVELSIGLTPVKTKIFTWTSTINWSKNSNKVLELADGIDRFELGSGDNLKLYAEVGKPYGVFYGNDFKRDENGNILVSMDKGRPVEQDFDAYLGGIQPDWFGGWTNTFRIWDFDLGFGLDFQKGGHVWSYTAYRGGIDGNTVQTLDGRLEYLLSKLAYNEEDWERAGYMLKDYVNDPSSVNYQYIYPDADSKKGVQLGNAIVENSFAAQEAGHAGEQSYAWINPMDYWCHDNTKSAARYIYDASFIKLREISVGYNLPARYLRKTFLKTAKLSFVGRNVAILYQKTPKGMDPQATSTTGNAQGFERGFTLPQATYGFDIKVTF